MVNYPILSSFPTLTTLFPYLRFKACLDHLMVFSLVYRGTRSWLWWHHQGLWHHYCDVRAHDPQLDPFSHHNLWTCTHTLHTNLVTLWHSPPPKSVLSSGLKKWMLYSLLTFEMYLGMLRWCPEHGLYPRMYFAYMTLYVTWLYIVGLSLERPFKIKTYSTIW